MVSIFVRLQNRLACFLADERGGERDTLTTLLILALIIVPLVLILIAFSGDIIQKAQDAWDSMFG